MCSLDHACLGFMLINLFVGFFFGLFVLYFNGWQLCPFYIHSHTKTGYIKEKIPRCMLLRDYSASILKAIKRNI